MKKQISAWILTVLVVATPVWAQNNKIDPSKLNLPPAMETIPTETKDLIRTLLDVNGTREGLTAILEEMVSRAPFDKRSEVRKILNSDAVIERTIPIYAKYFSAEELRTLITFYRSPVGIKNLKLTPTIMQDVMGQVGQYFQENSKALDVLVGPMPTGSSTQ